VVKWLVCTLSLVLGVIGPQVPAHAADRSSVVAAVIPPMHAPSRALYLPTDPGGGLVVERCDGLWSTDPLSQDQDLWVGPVVALAMSTNITTTSITVGCAIQGDPNPGVDIRDIKDASSAPVAPGIAVLNSTFQYRAATDDQYLCTFVYWTDDRGQHDWIADYDGSRPGPQCVRLVDVIPV
jgi:hypothetical protein